MTLPHVDIAIVGAGLTGQCFANIITSQHPQLRLALIDPHVNRPIETCSDIQNVNDFSNRVSAITPANVSALATYHCWPSDLNQNACAYDSMTVWDSETDGHVHFDAHLNEHRAIGYLVENHRLLQAMQQAHTAMRHQLSTFSAEITACHYADDKQHLTLSDGNQLTASLVVGADGSQSKVRALHDIDCKTHPYEQSAIVCTLKTAKPHGQTARQWFLPTGPLAFLPLHDGHDEDNYFVSVVWSVDAPEAEEILKLDDDAFLQAIGQASEFTLGHIEATSARQAFPLTAKHAHTYIANGLALIGDAAHVIHPLAGQGVNLGFQDAIALSQLIGEQLAHGRPIASQQMLARYQRQRRIDNESMQLSMTAFYKLFQQQQPALKFLRGAGMNLFNASDFAKKLALRHAMGERFL